MNKKAALVEHFSVIPDPRINRQKRHELIDIIAIAVCAVICGSEDWVDVEHFGHAKEDWLKTFLELPNGIPSHDTFGRVFSLLDSQAFLEAFINWTTIVNEVSEGEIIAIDSKGLRSIHNGNRHPIAMVSAWASEAGVVLGQKKIDHVGREKEGFESLIEILSVKGCIVTMDSGGCTSKITNKIVSKGGDYVVGLKSNQKTLLKHVQQAYETESIHSSSRTEEKNRDRHEIREADAMVLPREIFRSLNAKIRKEHPTQEWEKIESVLRIKSTRTLKGKTSIEERYYLSSLPADAVKLARCVRCHWGVENKVHYVMDVTFDEDHSRMRVGHAAENMSLIRRFALNLVRHEKTPKKSLKVKRKLAGWDNNFLVGILKGANEVGF